MLRQKARRHGAAQTSFCDSGLKAGQNECREIFQSWHQLCHASRALFARLSMPEDKPRILIVDDDGEIRDVLKEFLGRDYDCVTSDSAEKALDALATQQFHLILSDIAMTAMSGIEMLPRVVKLAPDSVVVMISGQRTIECAIDAMRAGAFDYITKPFELREVNAVVRRALDHQSSLKRFQHRRR